MHRPQGPYKAKKLLDFLHRWNEGLMQKAYFMHAGRRIVVRSQHPDAREIKPDEDPSWIMVT